ncbi:MAG: accessory gene regulator B family protein [Clostridiales bacterium]|nr:accessory gene regulator B family protein [Clostridiales bacterium]
MSKDQTDIVRYGLQSFYGAFTALLSVLILSAAIGIVREAMTVFFVVAVYRKLSGGAHCSTLPGCLTVGTLIIILFAVIIKNAGPTVSGTFLWVTVPSVIAFIPAYFYAPADVPQKPISSSAQRTMLRRLSFLFIVLWFIMGAYLWAGQKMDLLYFYAAGNLGLLWQSFLLTPPGYRLIEQLSLLFRRRQNS